MLKRGKVQLNIKEIIAVGCSHTFGAETIPKDSNHPESINHSFAKHLADKFKCKYTNISCCGICNFEIARRIQQHIDFKVKDLDGIFVIIGWTDHNRFSFSPEKHLQQTNPNTLASRIFNITSAEISAHNLITLINENHKENPYYLRRIRELDNGESFFQFLQSYFFNTSYYMDINFLIRLLTSNYLIAKKINHLTFPAHYTEKYHNTLKYEQALDNNHNLLQVKHRFNFLEDYKKYGIEPGHHLGRKAHKEFAQSLHKKILMGMGIIEGTGFEPVSKA